MLKKCVRERRNVQHHHVRMCASPKNIGPKAESANKGQGLKLFPWNGVLCLFTPATSVPHNHIYLGSTQLVER